MAGPVYITYGAPVSWSSNRGYRPGAQVCHNRVYSSALCFVFLFPDIECHVATGNLLFDGETGEVHHGGAGLHRLEKPCASHSRTFPQFASDGCGPACYCRRHYTSTIVPSYSLPIPLPVVTSRHQQWAANTKRARASTMPNQSSTREYPMRCPVSSYHWPMQMKWHRREAPSHCQTTCACHTDVPTGSRVRAYLANVHTSQRSAVVNASRVSDRGRRGPHTNAARAHRAAHHDKGRAASGVNIVKAV